MGKKKEVKAKTVYDNLMIDCETLGTRADSVILSIGAVFFNLDTGEIGDSAFYASVSIDSNHEVAPRHISEDTLIWWMDQSAEARMVFTEPKTTLYAALGDLSDWIAANDNEDIKAWSNGADFDLPLLAHAYSTNGLTVPWHFWNSRCFRTMKSHFKVAKTVPKPNNPCAHNALKDAMTQAQWLVDINRAILGK